jgi:hypothetical protein
MSGLGLNIIVYFSAGVVFFAVAATIFGWIKFTKEK